MNANEMIERYAHEVGRNLPRKGRADIEQELKSLLQDTVEERAGGAEPTEQTVVKVLLDFGSPEQMAAEYRPTQYVIGPRIYPIFRFVASIVLGAMAVAYVVLIMVTLWAGDRSNPAETIWNMTLSFGQSAIVSLGIVTLIFAALERFWGDQIEGELDSAEWDPTKLPPVDDPNRINRGEQIAGVIATVIFTGIFLMLIRPEGALAWLFTDEFRTLIPLIIASTALEVILNVLVIWQGRWTRTHADASKSAPNCLVGMSCTASLPAVPLQPSISSTGHSTLD